MATQKQYGLYVGNASVATLDANANPGPYDPLGETVMVEIDQAAEYATNFSTAEDSPNRQDLNIKIKDGPIGVAITCKEVGKRVMEMALHGTTTDVAAGSVANEELPSGLEVGQQYFTENPNIVAAGATMVDVDGNPVVNGTHFAAKESGAITMLNVNLTDGVKAAGNIHFASQPNAADTTTIGSKVYTWRVTPTLANEVRIGSTIAQSAANLANKINEDTLTTLCTAAVTSPDVALTANDFGTAGNSITLTVDATRLTKTAFASGANGTPLVQPFFISYSYGASAKAGIADDNPGNVAFRFTGKNLVTSAPLKNIRAFLKNCSFPPSSKWTLKSGSSGGTGNSVNEYEIKGTALDPDGTGFGDIDRW
jgi:hypothetical protein